MPNETLVANYALQVINLMTLQFPRELDFLQDIILEYKPDNTVYDPPEDLTLVIFSPNEETGAGLPLERTSATSWLHDGLVEMYVHALKDLRTPFLNTHKHPTQGPSSGKNLL